MKPETKRKLLNQFAEIELTMHRIESSMKEDKIKLKNAERLSGKKPEPVEDLSVYA